MLACCIISMKIFKKNVFKQIYAHFLKIFFFGEVKLWNLWCEFMKQSFPSKESFLKFETFTRLLLLCFKTQQQNYNMKSN